MIKHCFLLAVLLTSSSLLATETSNPFSKSWTHVNGNSAVLELLKIQEDNVTFLKPDGHTWTMSISKLVPGDRTIARQLASRRKLSVTRTKNQQLIRVSTHQDVDIDAVKAQFATLRDENPNLYSRLNELAEYPINEYELDVNSEGTVYLQFFLKPGVAADSSVESELASFLSPDPLEEVPFKLSQIEQEAEVALDSPSDLSAASDSNQPQSVVDAYEPPMPDDKNAIDLSTDYVDPLPVGDSDPMPGTLLPMVSSTASPTPLTSAIDCGCSTVSACPINTCASAVVYGCCETVPETCCPTTCCETTCCTNACAPAMDCCGTTSPCCRPQRVGLFRRLLNRLASCGGGCR